MRFQLIRARLSRVVLASDTSAGRIYNLVVFGAILLSVVGLLFEPAPGVALATSPPWLEWLDRVALAVFAADFVLHLLTSPRPLAYLRSFYGLIDLSAVLFFAVPQINSGLVLWVFKFGRILRVFKLLRFMDEARALGAALKASARRITVFILFVLILQVVLGYLMVVVESFHPESQFRTVAQGVYWAIVTMTTVGYGDIVPQTPIGRILAGAVMLLGFGIIAIPTGIVTVEGWRRAGAASAVRQLTCTGCGQESHRREAGFCDRCGAPLPPATAVQTPSPSPSSL
jgi:voltage-gated potassium channel